MYDLYEFRWQVLLSIQGGSSLSIGENLAGVEVEVEVEVLVTLELT
jgi:hypothetical protein